LGNTSRNFKDIVRDSFPPYLYVSFIHCVYGYLASMYLVSYLYNKSSIIEHQLTIGRLLGFVECVHHSGGHASTTAVGAEEWNRVCHEDQLG
jgi:hypothetical protein